MINDDWARREYLTAVAALLGVTLPGCSTSATMNHDEADRQFDDVQKFESPHGNYADAVRCVDEEAGVVIYAMSLGGSSHGGKGVGLTCVPRGETALNADESSE